MTRSLFHLLLASTLLASSRTAQTAWNFRCSPAKHTDARTLSAATVYNAPSTFGFDLATAPTAFDKGYCSGDKPFFFSLAVPDGNYEVTLDLGGKLASTTTVRAESRRLFVDQLHLSPKASQQAIFNVNVRTAIIYPAPGQPKTEGPLDHVRLKAREIAALDWDDKLTLEFNGDHPSFRSISIRAIADLPTIYLAGDSTVVDQDKEPWAAWGQMLPAFFGPGIAIANHAESGETIKSFVAERRYAKILSSIKPGDFLLIQFAHNDQKPGAVSLDEYRDLLRRYITDARSHGATPILVTSMNRRKFDENGKIVHTLGDYPQAMRDVAAAEQAPLIDLTALSKTLFEAMGEEGTLHAFVHYPANTFPNEPSELRDDTHFNSYGAYELARTIVQDIRDQHLPLEKHLRPNIPRFDPAHPDPSSAWTLPPSPQVSTTKPDGR